LNKIIPLVKNQPIKQKMNFKVLLTLLVLLSLLQFIAAGQGSSTIGLSGCMFPGERIGATHAGSSQALSVETESVTLSCKACHSEKCPHWKFDLKRSPQDIARLKQICKDKEVCACSDVALALMSEESTLEEGSTFMQSIQAVYQQPGTTAQGPESSCNTNTNTGSSGNQ
jgi:hypothetical protein